jgi:hypothetical protein
MSEREKSEDEATRAMAAASSDMQQAVIERQRSYKAHLSAALDDYRWLLEHGVRHGVTDRLALTDLEKLAANPPPG